MAETKAPDANDLPVFPDVAITSNTARMVSGEGGASVAVATGAAAAAAGRASRPNLEVELASGDALEVCEISVKERISTLFQIELVVRSPNPAIAFDAVVGQAARFTVHAGTHDRRWSGLCNRIELTRVEPDGLSTYLVSIVPVLWLLSQRRNHRMFQQISEPDIVLRILGEWDIRPDVRIDRAGYKKRKYRVQYGESDLAFLSRMLEDAGICYFFEEIGDDTTLVLADAPQSSPARQPPLPFIDDISTVRQVDRELVTALRVSQRVRPGKVTLRDHDYRRAASYPLVKTASGGLPAEDRLERFHYVPGAFLFGAEQGDATPNADDKGKTRTDEKEGALLAQKRLDAKRGSARVCTFEARAADLAPGVVARIIEHPHPALSGDLLIVASSLTGTSTGEWLHRCEARGVEVPFRPELATPKPKVNGVESATVVGPSGEEIHTDEFGRVRVHFHWDRESRMDDSSSCWIHVSQPWGGAGYGGTNLPRIGQEVLVDFLGGDPDRPVIVGRVYTNLQKTPYKLPDNKTQSGMRSNSTGGGGGYNEMMFEDAEGRELVNMQAQKDLKKLVKNNENVTIGNNRTKLVQSNDSLSVGQSRSKRVAKNEQVSIGVNQSISVGVNRSAQIGAVDATTVGVTHLVMISPPGEYGPSGTGTHTLLQDKKILLTTGAGASILLEGASIRIEADTIFLDGKNSIAAISSTGTADFVGRAEANLKSAGVATVRGASSTMITSGGDVNVVGAPMVKINANGLFCGRVTEPAPATILRGAATVLIGGPSFPFDVVRNPDGTIQVGNNMVIDGDEEFQSKTLAALAQVSLTPTGLGLLNSIDGGDKTVRIIPTPDGNELHFDGPGAFANADGTPGSGTDSTVHFNPDRSVIGSNPWNDRPPAIGLAHELIHAEQAGKGVTLNGQDNNDSLPDPSNPGGFAQQNQLELQTAGIPPYDNYPYNENKIRAEWDPPQPNRDWY
jgi:type VI secretion system secreted protein VgrG